ncbi:hypothetical protein AUC45_12770 [Erythrobacter sp. YT30]|nr:hypothetical protein AUC45_12770 [Erythrobacter sp. YT30]
MGREDHTSALPAMHAEATKHGYKDHAAAACSSLFELVEGHLGRQLVRECCCSPSFSSDEKALIGILRSALSLFSGRGSREVPHGLPGAISWAASCVCDAMGITIDPEIQALKSSSANRQDCPFKSTAGEAAIYGL